MSAPFPNAGGTTSDGVQQTPSTPPTGTPAAGATQTATNAADGTQGQGIAVTPPIPTPPTKTFGQEDVDRILRDRLERQEKSLIERFSKAFGVTPDEQDPAKALEAAEKTALAYQRQAQSAMARALAVEAGIKPEHVGRFVKLVDLAGALKDIDPTDTAAVETAMKAAVDAEAASVPEWKGGTVLPGSSGGDRQAGSSPSLDDRIAAAQKSGDVRAVIHLKRQKAAQNNTQ